MSFIPGKIVKEFTTKSGKPAVIRYPKWEDVGDLLKHINAISTEDTFINFSGEQQTIEDEARYLASEFAAMECGKAVKLFCYVENTFAGVCDIHQSFSHQKRGVHVGIFGLVIGKDYRGDGVGFALAQMTIKESKSIKELRMIQLDCFSTNVAGLHLYSKLGFAEVGRIPGSILYKNEYIDDVFMIRHL